MGLLSGILNKLSPTPVSYNSYGDKNKNAQM
jgi:hypothetical protein